jgi:hydrogenase expression/formation protein HypC
MCLAIPGKIESISNGDEALFRSGIVSFGGIKKEINLSMVPEAEVNEYVIVHAGIALNRIDEAEALRVLAYYKDSGDLEKELEE